MRPSSDSQTAGQRSTFYLCPRWALFFSFFLRPSFSHTLFLCFPPPPLLVKKIYSSGHALSMQMWLIIPQKHSVLDFTVVVYLGKPPACEESSCCSMFSLSWCVCVRVYVCVCATANDFYPVYMTASQATSHCWRNSVFGTFPVHTATF